MASSRTAAEHAGGPWPGPLLAPSEPESGAALALVQQRQPRYVSWADWQRLPALEVARGRASGRSRVRFTRLEEMLAALGL